MNILKTATKTTRYGWTDADRKERYYLTRKAKRIVKDETRKSFAEVMAAKLA